MPAMLIGLNKIPPISFMSAFATSLLSILDPNTHSDPSLGGGGGLVGAIKKIPRPPLQSCFLVAKLVQKLHKYGDKNGKGLVSKIEPAYGP